MLGLPVSFIVICKRGKCRNVTRTKMAFVDKIDDYLCRFLKIKSGCGFPKQNRWNNKIKQICQIQGQEAKIHFKHVAKALRDEQSDLLSSADPTNGSSRRLSAVWCHYNQSRIWSFKWSKSASRNSHRWIFPMRYSRSISPAWEV